MVILNNTISNTAELHLIFSRKCRRFKLLHNLLGLTVTQIPTANLLREKKWRLKQLDKNMCEWKALIFVLSVLDRNIYLKP